MSCEELEIVWNNIKAEARTLADCELDFPSVGPQHAYLNSTGRADYDLTLVPVQQTAVPVQASGGATTTVPSTSPTQVNPSSAVPAPTQY